MDDDEEEEEGELLEEDDGQMDFAELPFEAKGLRACKRCRLIKTFEQVGG
jgi:hypothetical protein